MNLKRIKTGVCTITLAVYAAAVMSGCGGKEEKPSESATAKTAETVTETSQTTATVAAAETQAAMEAAVKTQTGTNVNGDLLHALSGTVVEAGTETVTVKNEKYPEGLTFSTAEAATGLESAPAVDQDITVFYSGEIQEADASGVTVELMRGKREGDEEAQVAMVSGKIMGIGMSVVTIETADGRNLSFEQDPKPVNTTEGPVEGDRVTIVYSYQDEGQEGAVVPELICNEKS